MEWISLIATALGAAIAFSGGLLSDGMKSRRERTRSRLDAEHRIIVDFVLAVNDALAVLRSVAAQSIEASQLQVAPREAVWHSELYAAREQMLISAPPRVAFAAEGVFRSVTAVRDAVSSGAKLDSPPYRRAINEFGQSIWHLRQATREDFGIAALDLGKMRSAEAHRIDNEAPGTAADS